MRVGKKKKGIKETKKRKIKRNEAEYEEKKLRNIKKNKEIKNGRNKGV